jgi:protein O-GlcNAc transferase
MDYQRFIEQLPELYDDWMQETVRPRSDRFQNVFDRVVGMSTTGVLQLLNFAVDCMEPGEVYCEIGCFQGSTLVGALLDHPSQMAYVVDNFSEFDPQGTNEKALNENLENFGMQDQVLFSNQGFEEFFHNLGDLETEDKIGVYLYDGAHDYRSQLMGLLLAQPFLSDRALIIVDDSNWSTVKQADWDFIAAFPQCEMLIDIQTPRNSHPSFWNGLHVMSWDKNRSTPCAWNLLQENREHQIIQAIYQLQIE